MIRSYAYRLYPTAAQRTALNVTLEGHRILYNAALEERRTAYAKCGVNVTYKMQSDQLKAIRQSDPDFAHLNFSACQQTLRRLDKSFQAFFRRIRMGEKAGYPRFKARDRFDSIAYVYGDGIGRRANHLYIHRIGAIRTVYHRPLPDDAVMKMAVLKRDRFGNWGVVFQIEQPDPAPLPVTNAFVGIDVGLEKFATLSTGVMVENSRFFRKDAKALAKAQSRRDKLAKGSAERKQATRRVQHIHTRIANRRKDFAHKLSHYLADTFQVTVFEDLNTRNMMQNHALAKSIGDAAWNQLIQYTTYKAAEAGRTCVLVDPRYTSQDCSRCGDRVKKQLSERLHACPKCGLAIDRDLNASLNILARGLARIGNQSVVAPDFLSGE